MAAITVSTNYSDILPYTLNANRKFLKNWIFVTDSNDFKTIEILKKEPTVTIMYWDFQNNGKQFDKGGAVRHAQEYAYSVFPDDWYLIIDSDICLSSNFYVDLNNLDSNIAYGCSTRHDFYKLSDYRKNINFYNCPTYNFPLGFFQLYKQKHYYESSNSAASCDDQFIKRNFRHWEMLNNFTCNHLGKNEVNWYGGRKLGSDFLIDE
jgi:hypothetical protein